MAAFERLGVVQRQPRKASSIGWLGAYDGNVLGGLLIGVGMALTGACPGTVLVQLATGIRSGIWTACGGLIGGILHARFGSLLQRRPSASKHQVENEAKTMQTEFGISSDYVLLAYEVICLIGVSISNFIDLEPFGPLLHPIAGGALIGGAQATSLFWTGNSIGVSTAYEEAGRFFWYFFASKKQGGRPPTKAMTFALGILVGSFVLSQVIPARAMAYTADISGARALVGGCVMIFGARLAGGCTSGHGISGMATFSISSIISVIAMFGGGILASRLLLQR